jgi:aerobic-type carbon monoxide dehydrogenase small subunit (CoxS/CutS family)
MKQCTSCYRFLPDQYSQCRYCGSDRLTVFESLLASKFSQENKNYRIRVSRIKINGSDYEVAAPLDRGGLSVIRQAQFWHPSLKKDSKTLYRLC